MKRHSLSFSPRVFASLCVLTLFICMNGPQGYSQNSRATDNNTRELNEIENLRYLLSLLQQTENYGRSRFTADIHSRIGKIFETNGLYNQALTHYSRAYSIYSSYSQSDRESLNGSLWTLYDIGNIFYRLKQYENAIRIYQKTSFLFYKKGDYYGIASSFSNIGLCYSNWNKPDSALLYYEKALEIRMQIHDERIASFSLNQIGNLYQNQMMFPEALDAYKKASEIEKKHNSHKELVITYLNLSRVFYTLNEKDSAALYLRMSLEICDKLQNNEYLVHIYSEYAHQSQSDGDLKSAEAYFYKAILLAEKTGIIPLKSTIYQQFYEFSHNNGDYKTALEYLIKYNQLEDELRAQKTEERLKQMEFLILSEQLQSKIKSVEKENYINQLQNKNKSNILYYFIICSIILLLFAFGNIKKMNFRFQLIGDLFSDYSVLQYVVVFLFSLVYFTLFICLFTPFGLEVLDHRPGFWLHFTSGAIFSLNLVFWITLFSFTEKKSFPQYIMKHKYIILSVCIVVFNALLLYLFFRSQTGFITSFFQFFSLALFTFIAYVLPVYIIIIIIEKFLLKKHIAEAKVLSEHFRSSSQTVKSDVIISLKSAMTKEEISFSVAQLLFIEAQGNYCRLCLYEENEIKMKMIRLTMKLAEEQCSVVSNLVRCHKSYLVNTDHIVKVSGNSRGYQLSLCHTDEKIPVSKNYFSDKFIKNKG